MKIKKSENINCANIDEYIVEQVSSRCSVSTGVARKALICSQWNAEVAMNKIKSLNLFGVNLSIFANECQESQNKMDDLRDQIRSLSVKVQELTSVKYEKLQMTNGSDVLYCSGIPYFLTEEQVKELLETYGNLKTFCLAKDEKDGSSKGYCWFQYEDPSVTSFAISGLNGVVIGDGQLKVARNSIEKN